MTLCRNWPVFGLLALAVVVRATSADDCPAKDAKKAECCKEKAAKQCEEKSCFAELIQAIVQGGQMCDSS